MLSNCFDFECEPFFEFSILSVGTAPHFESLGFGAAPEFFGGWVFLLSEVRVEFLLFFVVLVVLVTAVGVQGVSDFCD